MPLPLRLPLRLRLPLPPCLPLPLPPPTLRLLPQHCRLLADTANLSAPAPADRLIQRPTQQRGRPACVAARGRPLAPRHVGDAVAAVRQQPVAQHL
eukprot:159476-Chlamydomonas_euryale.AAC.2